MFWKNDFIGSIGSSVSYLFFLPTQRAFFCGIEFFFGEISHLSLILASLIWDCQRRLAESFSINSLLINFPVFKGIRLT
jgi:hypothetical protein